MTADPEVLNIERASRDGPDASWLYRRRQTDYPEYLDPNDVDEDELAKWDADRATVDEILAKAGMSMGLRPALFPR